MSGLTKLGLALLLVFSFSLLGFFSELLYVLWRRRRRLRRSSASSGDPEIPGAGGGGASSKEILFYFLCWKNQSRVEPASSTAGSPALSAAAALAAPTAPTKTAYSEAAEEGELAQWHAMYFGPSRVLYTIKEEREEVESDGGMGVSGDGDGGELAETPFSTPCASPAFYTPTSSPPRAAAEAVRDPEVPSGGEEDGSVSPVAERA